MEEYLGYKIKKTKNCYEIYKDDKFQFSVSLEENPFVEIEKEVNLRESIKKKLNSSMRESISVLNNKFDPKEQPNCFELENYLRKAGYTLSDVLQEKNDIFLEINYWRAQLEFNPSIKYDKLTRSYQVLTTDYGYLVPSDLQMVILGYETAMEVISHIESLKLELILSEFTPEEE